MKVRVTSEIEGEKRERESDTLTRSEKVKRNVPQIRQEILYSLVSIKQV